MPLATYLGITDDPCALDGYGPIPAELARRIAAEAVRDHPASTTWRCVITHGERGEHTSVVGLTRPVRIATPTSTSTPGAAHVFNPVTATPLSTPKHDPPEQLTELMRISMSRCVFPGCGMPSIRCDLDHRIPYDHADPAAGGPTCSCNLQPLCRRHHRLKTTGLIGVEPLSPADAGGEEAPSAWLGSLRWTSRAGLTYTSAPESVVQPAAPQQAQALRDALYESRHADPESMIRLNQKLGEALRGNRANAGVEIVSCPEDTWTETIERPDDDGLHPDLTELNDPYADLPIPPLDWAEGA